MSPRTIAKARPPRGSQPNLDDWARARCEFRWESARSLLDGLPRGRGLNIAHEAVDRHALAGRGAHVAIRWLPKRGSPVDLSYDELLRRTNRFANALAALGVVEGDRVFALLGRIPELYVTALGALKHRTVFCPMFSAFGPEPVRQRLELGEARVLVTTAALYEKKVAALREALPRLEYVIVVGDPAPPGTLSFRELTDRASAVYVIEPTSAEAPALLHFTSGTTGTPKGALHVHQEIGRAHV